MNSCIMLALAIGFVSMLQSCKTMATADEMSTVHKGMSMDDVARMLDLKPEHSINFSADGKEFIVDVYALMTAQYTTSSSSASGISTSSTVSVSSPMLFLFRSDKLMYWGYMNEFSKSEESDINQLASNIYREYYHIYEK